MIEKRSVADVEGAWAEPDFSSGLIPRCREHWSTPISELSNQMLATYIRQSMGLVLILPEARRRLEEAFDDESELYDGELAAAVQSKN